MHWMVTLQEERTWAEAKFFIDEGSQVKNETIENPYKKTASEILLKCGKL